MARSVSKRAAITAIRSAIRRKPALELTQRSRRATDGKSSMSEWFGDRRQHAQGHILQRGRFVVGNRIEDDANGDEFLFEQE